MSCGMIRIHASKHNKVAIWGQADDVGRIRHVLEHFFFLSIAVHNDEDLATLASR